MKKVIILFFIVILFLTLVIYRNNDTGIIISGLGKRGNVEKSGKLIYRIYLLGILPIGEAILLPEQVEAYQGQEVYHLRGIARSLNYYSKIFKGYATVDSYVDLKQPKPLAYKEMLLCSGKKATNKEITYDQMQGIMHIEGVRRQIPPNTQDPLSIFFNIRRIDFDKTKEFEMNINTNQKNYILKGIAQLKDATINNKIYELAYLKLNISRGDENPYHKSSITMQLLRGKENIPILIKVFANGFLISARLIDIK